MAKFPVSALGLMRVPLAVFVLCASFDPATAIQPAREKITPEADGTVTCHFKIKIDETVHMDEPHAALACPGCPSQIDCRDRPADAEG